MHVGVSPMSHSNEMPTRPKMRGQRLPRGSGGQLREQIIDTATELIVASGDIKAPSTREVTRALDITAPSLYRHFADKDELLDAVCAKYYRRLGEGMQDATRALPTALQRLH